MNSENYMPTFKKLRKVLAIKLYNYVT
jgi:hypothetical protein